MESQNGEVPEKNCPKSDDLYLSQDLTEKNSIEMPEPRDELVTDAGNYEEGDIIQRVITVNPDEDVAEGADLVYIKTTDPSMKNFLDSFAKQLEDIKRQLSVHDEQLGDVSNKHHARELIFSVVEIGLALESHVLWLFYAGGNVPVHNRAKHLGLLSAEEKIAIASFDLYREAVDVLGDDFKVLVDYRNELAHPSKKLIECDLLEQKTRRRERVVDVIDNEMFEKAVDLKNRLKGVKNMDSIVENYKKRKINE